MSNFSPHAPGESTPSDGEVLANLALANKIFATNMEQQVLIARQQAMNILLLATLAKSVSLILEDPGRDMAAIHTAISTVKAVFDNHAPVVESESQQAIAPTA